MGAVTDAEAVLAARVVAVELRLARANILGADDVARLVVGPDDLEHDQEIVRFQGIEVLRVPHWSGEPVLCVSGGWAVAGAYMVARRIQNAGVPADRIRAFGPAGWEHVSLPLMGATNRRVDFTPADGLDGPMIGVELT